MHEQKNVIDYQDQLDEVLMEVYAFDVEIAGLMVYLEQTAKYSNDLRQAVQAGIMVDKIKAFLKNVEQKCKY